MNIVNIKILSVNSLSNTTQCPECVITIHIKKIWHLLYLFEISLGHKHDLVQTCVKNSKNPFLPLQAFSLVQSPESSIGVHLMVIDGGSHEEEGGVGSIHTLRHLLV